MLLLELVPFRFIYKCFVYLSDTKYRLKLTCCHDCGLQHVLQKGGHKNNHVYWREDSRAEISPDHLLLFPKIKNNETRPVHVCAGLFITRITYFWQTSSYVEPITRNLFNALDAMKLQMFLFGDKKYSIVVLECLGQ